MSRLFNLAHHFYTGLDWLFPPYCAGCEELGHRYCPDCIENSEKIANAICVSCGNPLISENICRSCKENPPSFDAARSWGLHTGTLRNAVLQLKYRRNIALGEILANLIVGLVKSQEWDIDLVIPIPLAKKRFKDRGYNQATLLAYPLAWAMNTDFDNKSLFRIKETRTQIGLNINERRDNVRNAFVLKSNIVKEKTILLVDDVITTGATLNSASMALLNDGAKNVFAVTLARATGLLQK